MLQVQDLPQQAFFGPAELGHVRAGLRPAQQRGQRNEQNVQQLVLGIVRPRIGQPSENFLEFPHRTLPVLRESSSESILRGGAIPLSNPYAIPLPWRGRVGSERSASCRGGVMLLHPTRLAALRLADLPLQGRESEGSALSAAPRGILRGIRPPSSDGA